MNRTWLVVTGILAAGVWMDPALAGENPWRAQADFYGRPAPVMPEPPPAAGFGRQGMESLYPPEDGELTLMSPAPKKDPVYPPLPGKAIDEKPKVPDPVYPPTPKKKRIEAQPIPAQPPAPVRGQVAPGSIGGDGATAGGVPSVGYSLPTWGAPGVSGQPYSGYPAHTSPYGYGYTAPGTGYDPIYWNALNPGAANMHGWGAPGMGVPGFLGGTPWIGTPSTGWGW